MIEIKDLLLKFKSLLIKEEVKIPLIILAIKEETGIKIEKEQVKIKNKNVFLSIKQIYKNEIFIKKEKIISNLNKKLGKQTLKEIF